MSFRQFDLKSLTNDHDDHRLTCWLRDDPRLRVGVLITLRDDGHRVWEIVRRSQVQLATPPDTRWKVGGLL